MAKKKTISKLNRRYGIDEDTNGFNFFWVRDNGMHVPVAPCECPKDVVIELLEATGRDGNKYGYKNGEVTMNKFKVVLCKIHGCKGAHERVLLETLEDIEKYAEENFVLDGVLSHWVDGINSGRKVVVNEVGGWAFDTSFDICEVVYDPNA